MLFRHAAATSAFPASIFDPSAVRPMIAWSIEAARAGCFDRNFVSADDEEIAAVAVSHGADVPFPDLHTSLMIMPPPRPWFCMPCSGVNSRACRWMPCVASTPQLHSCSLRTCNKLNSVYGFACWECRVYCHLIPISHSTADQS